MSSIDDRVVEMKFDNAQFEQGIKTTLASLDALNKSLKLEGATKGFSDLDAAGRSVHLGHIAAGVDDIANRFKAMSVVAITALATIAQRAVSTGLSVAKSLTVAPIAAGLHEYETNLNSIQTILSNTQWQNTTLKDVNESLRILNEYSDKTIYNFGQMARNIGTFTAAGVKLDVATNAIKGIANLAAISGSNAEQASAAMYQLSQALATGTLKLIDWNSVVNAGLGGKVFQDALIETARVHHVAVDQMIKDAGSFRGSLEKGWVTSGILTETLQKFTGDLTEAQLKAMGYNNQQIAGILKMGVTAQDAATKIKTVSQLISTLQESAGSGWATTWQTIFGDFEEAKALFTDVNNTLGAFIQSSADARNAVLGDWKELGGRTALIDAIGNSFHALLAFLKPIGDAWRSAFPAVTGKNLADLSNVLKHFSEGLKISSETADKLRRTFAGLFAVFGIGWDVVKLAATTIFSLFETLSGGSGDVLEITANIGDFLVSLRKAIQEGEGLVHLFQFIGRVLTIPIELIKYFAHLVAQVFDGFQPDSAAQGVVAFVQQFGPLGTLADFIAYVWDRVVHTFDNVWHTLEPLADKFMEWFQQIDAAVGGVNFADLLDAINTGALVGLVLVLKNMFGSGGVTGVLKELTSTLSTMQTTLQATTLLEIALAVGILAIAISALSKIDGNKLTTALSALAVMFTQLIAALYVLSQLPSNNVVKLYIMAASLVVLSVAINVLAIAVKSLSDLSWEEMVKGLVGVSVLLAAITTAAVFLPDGARLTSTGVGLLILSAAIKVLASAVNDLSGLSWEEMAKGLAGVGALLAALTLFTRFAEVNATGVLAGAGIVLLAVGIKILASAIKDISGISWENIGKGMATLATSLAAIGAALYLIPPTAPLQAAGIVIVATSLLILAEAIKSIAGVSWENVGKGLTVLAGALVLISAALLLIPPTAPLSAAGVLIVALAIQILAEALAKMGNFSWTEIGKGLTVLAGALAIITGALLLLPAALPGAFALLIVAGALAILTPILKVLGNMSWGEIVKGLVALAAAFAIIGIAGALMSSVVPTLIGLGFAIALIGAGLALAGAGVFLFAAGLTALSVAGAAGAAAVVAILSAIIGLIPAIVKQVGVALLLLIDILIEGIPKIVKLIVDLILQLLSSLDEVLPKLAEVIVKLIVLILLILEQAIPKMVVAGLHILIGILTGIRDNIGQIVRLAGQIIENFIRALGNSLPGIIQAGVDLILAFVRGLKKAIDNNSAALGEAGADLALAIVKGMVRGLGSGTGKIADAARNAAKSALNAALDFLGIRSPSKEFIKVGEASSEGLAVGLTNYIRQIERAAEVVGGTAIDTLRDVLSNVNEVVAGDLDMNPVITPVLDLSIVKKRSDELGSLLNAKPVKVNASYSSAQFAAHGYQQNQDDQNPGDDGSDGGNTYNFNQYNSSPKTLSTAEIYRQTKNQLSVAKGGLPS
jgi:hypothetical protein